MLSAGVWFLLSRSTPHPQPRLQLLPITPSQADPISTNELHFVFAIFVQLQALHAIQVHDAGTVNAAKHSLI